LADALKVRAIEHVQLAMPKGEEQKARDFYCGVLGIPERTKPAELAKRGGVWFEDGALKIHLGVEADFRPARKAHPALLVDGLTALIEKLKAAGHQVNEEPMAGYRRIYAEDPFGNRLELMEKL
jgi:catechol 2,3-dioxygenase-like lactoylglutathione lyase family enzyme